MRIISEPQWNSNVLTIPDLDMSPENLTGKAKFYVSNDPSGNGEVCIEVDCEKDQSGNNTNQFKLKKEYNNVFFYGKEVNDFHTIDKNQIFALHHSAIQELDRKVEKIIAPEKQINYTQDNVNGLIVSANQNAYINDASNILTKSLNSAKNINIAYPVIKITDKSYDKSVYGIMNDGIINTSGTGSIWVTNINGNLESGDYITSSDISGFGMLQGDSILHNYTVAKITMDCDFTGNQQTTISIANKTHTSLEWTTLQKNNTTEYEAKYPMKYLSNKGDTISFTEYTNQKNGGESVYLAAFVGCTYHCG
jgi:hypothetical protein